LGQQLSETQADLGRERQTGIQREQFIAVLGHDLRNPLAALEAGLSLMKRAPDPRRTEFIMSAMQATIDRMNAMVGNILDFARGRLVGDLPLRFKPESPEVIVTQIVNELAIAHPEREIVLDCDSATPLMCDAQRIGQLVSNLVGNALTHGEQGTPVVVECHESEDEFILSVTNNGPEIPMHVRGTLFQPFEQGAESHASGSLGLGLYIASTIAKAHGGSLTVQSSSTETIFTFRMGKGAGLGLSMVHGLAAQSGGRLALSSQPDQGTVAEILLPAASSEALSHVSPVEMPLLETDPLRILLVDDEDVVREGTAAMLEEMGHIVSQAGSGAQALGQIRSQPFDIVVTDYLMPSMSGLELAREARKVRSDIPVLMITGFADLAEDTASDVLRLPKPFRAAEMARAIHDAMAEEMLAS